MVVVGLSRRIATTSSHEVVARHDIPKLLSQCLPTPNSIPFYSQIQIQEDKQQRNLRESHLISILNGCRKLAQIKQVHSRIILNGLDQSCYVITKLVRTLSKLDISMEDPYPRSIFDQVQRPNAFLYTAVIRGYSAQRRLRDAVRLYLVMRREGTRPVSFTFSALFKACGAAMDVGLGKQMHTQTILIGGFGADLHVYNTIIDMYVKCGFLACGRKVFDDMPERDAISCTELIVACAKSGDMKSAGELFDELPVKDMVAWTAMITGLAQNAMPKEAIDFFERMQNAGVRTDEVTLCGVISACAQLGAAKFADWITDVVEKSGFGSGHSVVVGSALVDMYSKSGNVDVAYQIFQQMNEKNVFTYSSMIMGFAIHGRPHAALELFGEMLKTETKPNGVTFIGLLTACSHAGMVEEGQRIFESMGKCYEIEPSADHYVCMVDLLGRAGCLREALEFIETMPMEPSGGVWGALLGACRIHRNPDYAKIAATHLFELEPDVIGNYILLSNIYASAGRWEDASRVKKLMLDKCLKKNPACSWLETDKGVRNEFVCSGY